MTSDTLPAQTVAACPYRAPPLLAGLALLTRPVLDASGLTPPSRLAPAGCVRA